MLPLSSKLILSLMRIKQVWPMSNTIWEPVMSHKSCNFYQSALNPYWVILLTSQSDSKKCVIHEQEYASQFDI